mmetsp:Transcript_136619/g.345993  ORF Transcript_136619/g.345993 Transcript_136619/m.345993 type:complete len:235 (+) Transcript_136619:611-1315(+)
MDPIDLCLQVAFFVLPWPHAGVGNVGIIRSPSRSMPVAGVVQTPERAPSPAGVCLSVAKFTHQLRDARFQDGAGNSVDCDLVLLGGHRESGAVDGEVATAVHAALQGGDAGHLGVHGEVVRRARLEVQKAGPLQVQVADAPMRRCLDDLAQAIPVVRAASLRLVPGEARVVWAVSAVRVQGPEPQGDVDVPGPDELVAGHGTGELFEAALPAPVLCDRSLVLVKGADCLAHLEL